MYIYIYWPLVYIIQLSSHHPNPSIYSANWWAGDTWRLIHQKTQSLLTLVMTRTWTKHDNMHQHSNLPCIGTRDHLLEQTLADAANWISMCTKFLIVNIATNYQNLKYWIHAHDHLHSLTSESRSNSVSKSTSEMHSNPGLHLFLEQYCTDFPTTEEDVDPLEKFSSFWKDNRSLNLSGSILLLMRTNDLTSFDLTTLCLNFLIVLAATRNWPWFLISQLFSRECSSLKLLETYFWAELECMVSRWEKHGQQGGLGKVLARWGSNLGSGRRRYILPSSSSISKGNMPLW